MRVTPANDKVTGHKKIPPIERPCPLGEQCPCRRMSSPRHRQTLHRLMEGDSEKQAARHLGISPHTLHLYVRQMFRTFDVDSRGELMARIIHQHEETVCRYEQILARWRASMEAMLGLPLNDGGRQIALVRDLNELVVPQPRQHQYVA